MVVKCNVTQCAYNKELKCTNEEIHLDDLGLCCSEISPIEKQRQKGMLDNSDKE